MTIGDWLREAAWTQDELAKALDVDRTTVCHLVSGDKTPSLSLALKIQLATGGQVTTMDWPPRRDGKRKLRAAYGSKGGVRR